MPIGQEVYYGNEWIDYTQQYIKINLAEEGVYRIGYPELLETAAFGGSNKARPRRYKDRASGRFCRSLVDE